MFLFKSIFHTYYCIHNISQNKNDYVIALFDI